MTLINIIRFTFAVATLALLSSMRPLDKHPSSLPSNSIQLRRM
jgi:hypothetical protein